MGTVLYIVSTYYHALISCVKQLTYHRDADIICTDYIPNGIVLADKIRESGLFGNTYYIGSIDEYVPTGKLNRIFLFHRKNGDLIDQQLPMEINIKKYDEINIFHDDTWAAHYLKDKRIKYRLIEDALDSFKNISGTKFSYMLPQNRPKDIIKRALRIGYVFCGYDPLTYEVEVNDKHGVEIADFASDKLVEIPRRSLFDLLAESDIEMLCNIFMKDIPHIKPQKSVLLLTYPLFIDGLVSSPEYQEKLYVETVAKYLSANEVLIVKPHPRDTLDYAKLFPQGVILDKNMPAEILEYAINDPFRKLIGFPSTALYAIPADEYIEEKFEK